MFDRRDLKVYFRELTWIRQHGIVDGYVVEFQRLDVMVPDVTYRRLMFLFIEGISKSFCGL